MLVLSRKQDQAVTFPGLGISVHVCQLLGNKVRLGFQAPKDVEILRQELCDQLDREEAPREEQHRCKNQLNAATVAMSLAQRQLEVGQVDEAQQTLDSALKSLTTLENAVNGSSETDARQADAPHVSARETVTQTSKRALVVEDNDNERELLAGYLRLSGFEVETAANGLEAIKQLQQSDELPQAVILDMRMPKLDGAKTISNIRHRDEMKNLRVFAVSGTSPQEMNVPIGSRGVDGWFEKPVDPSRIVAQLNAESAEFSPGYIWPLGVSYVAQKVLESA